MQTGLILESELTSVEAIKCLVLTYGSIRDSTESIRGRTATPSLHLTEEAMIEEINSIMDTNADAVFAYREIAALRFDSSHGSLLVADLWGETRYKPFTGVKGRAYLTDSTPLLKIAQAADAQAASMPNSQVLVTVIGLEQTTPLKPRERLLAFSSYTVPEEGDFMWAEDPNQYKATNARAVKKNFEEVQKGAAHEPSRRSHKVIRHRPNKFIWREGDVTIIKAKDVDGSK